MIMRMFYYVLLVSLLVVMLAGVASAANIYPTVAFSFDPETYTYTYTVTVSPNDTFPLGYLELDTLVKNEGLTTWTMSGPWEGSVDLGWSTTWFEYEPGHDAAVWFADAANEIYPGEVDWVGRFVLVAPNTYPADGFGLTMDGSIWSGNPFTIEVPGPAGVIPEPSSLLALAGGLTGLAGFVIRRRSV